MRASPQTYRVPEDRRSASPPVKRVLLISNRSVSENLELAAVWAARWRILLAVIVVGAAAGFLSSSRSKVYSAEAIVRILPGGQDSNSSLNPDALQQVASAYAQLARSPSVESGVPRPPKSAVTFDVESRESGLINLVARSRNAQASSDASNAYAQAFIRRVADIGDAERTSALTRITQRVTAITRELRTLGAEASERAGLSAELEALQARSALVQTQVADQAQLITRAVRPKAADSPKPIRDGVLGSLIILISSAGLVYARSASNPRYRSADEAAEDLGLTLLAEVPRVKEFASAAEAFRVLRAASQFALERQRSAVGTTVHRADTIMIGAADPRSGKTFVSCGLARAWAASGHQVALIDADLRKPDVHRQLGLGISPGVVDIVTDGKQPELQTVENGVVTVDGEAVGDLKVLPAGRAVEMSSELVASPSMSALVDRMASEASGLVIDTPPLLSLPDAAILSRMVDGVVFVVEPSQTTRRGARRSLAMLRQADANVIGFVFNGARQTSGYYGYGYGPDALDRGPTVG